MAEEIPKEELEAPQKINEAAIQELINLWLMDYKPADTVDSSSNLPVTGKAVANYVNGIVRKPQMTNITWNDQTDTGIVLVHNIVERSNQGRKLEFALSKITPQDPSSEGIMFYVIGFNLNQRMILYPSDGFSTATLSFMIAKDIDFPGKRALTFLHRTAKLRMGTAADGYNGKWILEISPAFRSILTADSNGKDLKLDTYSDPVLAERRSTRPTYIIFF